MVDLNSMSYWYNQTKDLDILYPRSVEIPFNVIFFDYFKKEYGWSKIKEMASTIMEKINATDFLPNVGTGPVFIRTDHTSGKHDYENTCKLTKSCVANQELLAQHLYALIEDNAMKSLYPKSFFLREFIELDSYFNAFRGLPIAPEIRLFANDGKIMCAHNYWPKAAITGANQVYWEELYDRLNDVVFSEFSKVIKPAKMISSKLPGYWSIDFARAKSGDWYFIDAALGQMSYHWPDCKFTEVES